MPWQTKPSVGSFARHCLTACKMRLRLPLSPFSTFPYSTFTTPGGGAKETIPILKEQVRNGALTWTTVSDPPANVKIKNWATGRERRKAEGTTGGWGKAQRCPCSRATIVLARLALPKRVGQFPAMRAEKRCAGAAMKHVRGRHPD